MGLLGNTVLPRAGTGAMAGIGVWTRCAECRMQNMPPTKNRNSLIARWGAIAGAFLALLGGSLAPNLIASDLFAWAFTPENINIYRVLIGLAWVLFALFMFATLRAQKQSGSQTNINTCGGSSVGGSVNANEFVGRDKIQNFFSSQGKLEVLRETNYENIVGGLGRSGSIRWVDRGASTTAQLQARGRIAIIGEMKSGKTREAAELIRRAAAEGLIQTVYAPVAFPEYLDETQLREAVQREIDATRHCALFVDELDLHSDDFKLARLNAYYNAMLAVRPDAQFIITAQEERLMPNLRQWLEERNFFFVKVPDLNADQRLKIVQDGANRLNVTLADAETQHILAEQTDGRPYSIIFALQQTGEETLTADKRVFFKWSDKIGGCVMSNQSIQPI